MTHFTKLFVFSLCASVVSTSHAAWFCDRDNSMVNAHDTVGESMVVISAKSGSSTATKVYCPKRPGTILASAHGVINRKKDLVSKNIWGIYTFPVSSNINSKVSQDSQIISPQLRTEADWSDPTKDYAFVTPDRELKPEVEGLRIVRATAKELSQAAQSTNLHVYLYRGKTTFALNAFGQPDFQSSVTARSALKVYDTPQKVVKPCKVNALETRTNITTTNCPLESGVSGSPFVLETSKISYISGITKSADMKHIKSYNPHEFGSNFINSDQFCTDYQNVCGVSCTEINSLINLSSVKPTAPIPAPSTSSPSCKAQEKLDFVPIELSERELDRLLE